MKKQILFLAICMTISFHSFSQILFEKGYFINNSNQTIACLIKNIDWKNNPTKFEYRLAQDSMIQTENMETVKEFGIIGVSKYVRATVQLDRSSNELNNMSWEKNPNFLEEQLFLKVLVEGNATLFQYEDGYLIRFFFCLKDSAIQQLVYKRYLVDETIAQNNYFKQQLFNELSCQAITLNDVENISYSKSDLVEFFVKYNKCNSSSFVNYASKPKIDLFNLSLRPGINYCQLAIQNSTVKSWNINFDNKFSFRFGVEAEFILPYNKSKWGILIEPTYQYYSAENTKQVSTVSGGIHVSQVKYQSIELPIGIRYYLFFNRASKIFTDISYILDFNAKNSFVKLMVPAGSTMNSLEVRSSKNFGLGIGYNYKNKYSIEMRYQTSREILGEYVYWDSSYKTSSIIFGYSLF